MFMYKKNRVVARAVLPANILRSDKIFFMYLPIQIVIIAACIAVAVAVHGPVGYSVHTVHDDHHGGHYGGGGGHYGGGIVGGHYGGAGGYAGVAHGYYGHGDAHGHQDYHVIFDIVIYQCLL